MAVPYKQVSGSNVMETGAALQWPCALADVAALLGLGLVAAPVQPTSRGTMLIEADGLYARVDDLVIKQASHRWVVTPTDWVGVLPSGFISTFTVDGFAAVRTDTAGS